MAQPAVSSKLDRLLIAGSYIQVVGSYIQVVGSYIQVVGARRAVPARTSKYFIIEWERL